MAAFFSIRNFSLGIWDPFFSFLSLLDDRFPDYGKVEFVFSYGPEKIQGIDDVLALSLHPCLPPLTLSIPPLVSSTNTMVLLRWVKVQDQGIRVDFQAKPDPAP